MAINLKRDGADAAFTLSWLYVRPLILKEEASTSDQYSGESIGGGIVPNVPLKSQQSEIEFRTCHNERV